MSVSVDPEGVETAAMFSLVDFASASVLEVGCGDGRLTWRYAAEAVSVVAIDPNREKIDLAVANTPRDLKHKVRFLAEDINEMDVPDQAFDIAILAHSL